MPAVPAIIAILDLGFPYELMAYAHILSVVVAFGPLFLYPTLAKTGQTQAIAATHMRLTLPALVVMWVLGMGLAGMSEDAYELSQLWLALSIVNWIVLVAVSWFLIRPALTDPSDAARSKLSAGVGITHLGLVVGLALMVWKPGL